MTTMEPVGRPRRARPTDRVNYKLDSAIRQMLTRISDRQGRNEGSQVEQMVLFYEAATRLNSEGTSLTLDSINAKIGEIWEEIVQPSDDQTDPPT